MTNSELKELALHVARHTVPTNYANQNVDLNAALADGFKELAGTWNQWQQNKYVIFEILTEVINDPKPNDVLAALSRFAEIRTAERGQRIVYRRSLGRNRAKTFLTAAALSGVYETFRLDSEDFSLNTHNVGIGGEIDFERLREGTESLTEVMDVIYEAMNEAVLKEVVNALQNAYATGSFPDANRATYAGWDPATMIALMNVVKAYGSGAVIFATDAFIQAMGADVIVAAASGMPNVSIDDIESIHNTGLIRMFRGAPVVEIPNSFVDETNTTKVFEDQYAYVFPQGRTEAEKVVKVALEGPIDVWDWTNKDRSMEIMAQRRIGVGLLTYHNWAIYQNSNL